MDFFILDVGGETLKLLHKGVLHLFEVDLREFFLFGLDGGGVASAQIEQLCFLEILELEVEKLISLVVVEDDFLVVLIFDLIALLFIVYISLIQDQLVIDIFFEDVRSELTIGHWQQIMKV